MARSSFVYRNPTGDPKLRQRKGCLTHQTGSANIPAACPVGRRTVYAPLRRETTLRGAGLRYLRLASPLGSVTIQPARYA